MREFTFVIRDADGIHARPAGQLVKLAQSFSADAVLTRGEKSASLKKLFALMSLAVKQGQEVRVNVAGADENIAADALETFFRSNL